MKQVWISLAIVMVAAGIFAGMVLYTVSVMRQTQLRILTGQVLSSEDTHNEKLIPVYME